MLCGLVRLFSTPMGVFDLWMTWMLGPGALAILWVSGRPVSAWSTALSLGSVEYGLGGQSLAPRLQAFGSHLVLLHFVVLTLLPLVWILDIALSPGNALGGAPHWPLHHRALFQHAGERGVLDVDAFH